MQEKDFSIDKIPPHSIEAEQAVLGAMLLENVAIAKAQETLSAESFYLEHHRRIFCAITDAFKERGAVDLLVLVDVLRQRGQLDAVGGMAYVANLVDEFVSSAMLAGHIGIVKRKAILRRIISDASEIMCMAYDDRQPLEDILAKLQQLSVEALQQSLSVEETNQRIISFEHMQNYFASCRETPWESLNRAIGGLFGGQLIIVGARGGMGKTAFTHSLLRHTAIKEGRPSIYFGAEMSREVIYARLLAAESRIPYNDLKRGRIGNDQAKVLLAAHKAIDQAPISEYVIKDKLSLIVLMGLVRKFVERAEADIGLVVIENLQQIVWPKTNRIFRSRKEEVDAILENLRSLGLELKIPIIISCQINRDAEKDKDKDDRRPELSDLKDTGQTEEIADVVLFPFRPDYYERNRKIVPRYEKAELIIAKGGPPITLPMAFFGEYLHWEEIDEEDEAFAV